MRWTSECLAAGPHAEQAIAALRDLGLSRSAIARYLRVDEASLDRLLAASRRDRFDNVSTPPREFDPAKSAARRPR
jgi:hypothetical protein